MVGVDTRFLAYLTIDITYACNLRCPFCSKRIGQRNGKHMTDEQFAVVLKFVIPHYKIIHITGGEPLMHPRFNSMMRKLLELDKKVVVTTNGIALSNVDKNIYDKLNFLVSVYEGINDDVVNQVESYSNVICRRELISAPGLCDPYYDPDIDSDEECKHVYAGCRYSYAKVIGDKAYACCHAETSETFYGVEGLGVRISASWIGDLQQKDNWKACRHCFLAYQKPWKAV